MLYSKQQIGNSLKAIGKVYLDIFGFWLKVVLITGMGVIMILSILKIAGF